MKIIENIKEIISDYRFVKKRINIEYDIKIRQGGTEKQVEDAWQSEGVGFDLSNKDAKKISGILALLIHPIKSNLCVFKYSLENKEF